MVHDPKEVTQLLIRWSNGHREALTELTPFVDSELRRLADHYFRSERPDHTLQPTALVHEAYLGLADQTNVRSQTRPIFLALLPI